MKKMQLVLFMTAMIVAGVFMSPASAQQVILISASNQTLNVTYVPVSGTIAFQAGNYNNVTSVAELTVYARSQDLVDTKASPAADGTFNMSVPGAGNYTFWVIPSKLDYMNASTNETYQVQYPDITSPYAATVPESGLSGLALPTTTVITGEPMNATPVPLPTATATPKPTPGFTLIGVLAVLGIVCALAYRKK